MVKAPPHAAKDIIFFYQNQRHYVTLQTNYIELGVLNFVMYARRDVHTED
jgi:hypothetical protein